MNSGWQKIKMQDVSEDINKVLDAIKRAPIVTFPKYYQNNLILFSWVLTTRMCLIFKIKIEL